MPDSTPPNEDPQATAAPPSNPDDRPTRTSAPPSAPAAPASGPAAEVAPPPDPLAEARAEAARLKEQWMRTAADFDNFRKRARRDVDEARRGGREELLKDLLPVFDNLERAIQSAQRATEVKPVAEGLAMVVKQFVDVVGRAGITKVPTVGNAFDPSIHEAIQQVETDEHAPGTVVSEVQPGYLQGERLVRAAMVVVAKAKTGDAPAAS